MPKNTKKQKNSSKSNKNTIKTKRELLLKKDVPDTDYGQVTKLEGMCHFRVNLVNQENKNVFCRIAGAIKKKSKIMVDSLVLVGIRSYQEDKADIVYLYNSEEVCELKRLKEIPYNTEEGDDASSEEEVIEFDFDQI